MAPARLRPLEAARVVGASPGWSEPRLSGGRLFWLERRPDQRGRTRLLCRPLDALEGPPPEPLELTAAPTDLRSRVHDYGGGAYAVASDAAGCTTLVWVNDADRALWCLELPAALEAVATGDPGTSGEVGKAVDPGEPRAAAAPLAAAPRRLTAPDPERRFADGLLDLARNRWIGVLELGEEEALVSVPLAGGEPQPLWRAPDFCGYAVLSPDGSRLAWVAWQRPWMPWERSQLWLARLTPAGELQEPRLIAGSGAGDSKGIAVFQPLWIPAVEGPAHLVVANDRSGWWNLELLEAAEAFPPEAPPVWRPLSPQQAEFGMPQWVYGLRSTAWDGEALVAAACRQGRWELGRLTLPDRVVGAEPRANQAPPGDWQLLEPPFDDLSAVVADQGRVVAVAASASEPAGLLEIDLASGRWRHTPASPRPLPAEAISRPEPIWFEPQPGRPTHAWYYPPAGGGGPDAPLLLRAHSGPTGMARTGLNLAIQFWTGRGWGVLDVNYGGSTGFGRAYRQRLDGGWGVVDVADCLAAARAVVDSGRADPERIAMEGGSAAGFTVLAAIARGDTIRAGAVRYPVTDLTALATGEHRFEAGYCDGLIGPWPEARTLYEQRSPLRQVDRIQAPLLVFHGLDDRVVPPDQSERLALALSDRGIPVEVHLFPGEGHGFRDGAVQRRVLEATEAFFRRHFGL